MSAYICSKKHIQTVASEFVKIFGGDVLEVANELYKENIKSVNHRYEGSQRLSKFKTVGKTKEVKDIELYKLVCCIQYQSCEHDDWKQSKAYKMLDKLEKHLLAIIEQSYGLDEDKISASKHYQVAAWSI